MAHVVTLRGGPMGYQSRVELDGVELPKVRAVTVHSEASKVSTATIELIAVDSDIEVAADVTVVVYRLERSWWDRLVNAWRRWQRW